MHGYEGGTSLEVLSIGFPPEQDESSTAMIGVAITRGESAAIMSALLAESRILSTLKTAFPDINVVAVVDGGCFEKHIPTAHAW